MWARVKVWYHYALTCENVEKSKVRYHYNFTFEDVAYSKDTISQFFDMGCVLE